MTIRFSEWSTWSNRNNLFDIDQSGVYVIAEGRNLGSRPSIRNPTNRIIYIGQTTDKTLRLRLNGFNRSCKGGSGHQAGRLYFSDKICPEYPDWVRDAMNAHNLSRGKASNLVRDSPEFMGLLEEFSTLWHDRRRRVKVAIWTPTEQWKDRFGELSEDLHLKFVEARLLVKFVEKHQRLPKYNRRFG